MDEIAGDAAGTYTAWRRFDVIKGGDVRERLRVAAFDYESVAIDPRPAAVFDYAFLLRRPVGR